jgi:hypothetical protein
MAQKPDAANIMQLLRVPPTIEVGVFADWFSQAGPAGPRLSALDHPA